MTGDGDTIAARLTFSGRNIGEAFLAFAADRAARFSLGGWAGARDGVEATVVLRGPAALVDMFEVACLLGPVECIVEDVTLHLINDTDIGAGFRIDARRHGTMPDR